MQQQYSNSGNVGTLRGPRPNQSSYKQLDQRRSIERKQSKTQIELDKTEKVDIRKTSLLSKRKELPMPRKELATFDNETLPYPDIARSRRRNIKNQLESLSISDIDDDCSSISSFSSLDDKLEKGHEELRFDPSSVSTSSNANRDPELIIPVMETSGYSGSDSSDYDDDDDDDEDDAIENNVNNFSAVQINKPNVKDLPPVPTNSAPGYDDSDEEPMPPIPVINAPDDSDDEVTFQIPTINVPGDTDDEEADDDQLEVDSEENRILDSLFGSAKCSGCKKRFTTEQIIKTRNHHWHPKCFKCQECKINLEHVLYHEYNGLPYCAFDYHEQFSPKCAFCETPIEEVILFACGKNYHPGHFFCRECGCPLHEHSKMWEINGHGYCEKDYLKLFATKCRGCGEHITGGSLIALGGNWHNSCFTCADCGSTFPSSTFSIKNNKPYCNVPCQKGPTKKSPDIYTFPSLTHVKICHSCDKFIEGRAFSAFGKDYHQRHFKCIRCNTELKVSLKGTFFFFFNTIFIYINLS
jgi:hypothetical protein